MTHKTVHEGELYKHFKGQIYQIRALATNSADNTAMVVYQAMYPPFVTWVRPLSSFLEKIDKNIYPDATQEYRFEKITFDGQNPDIEKICTTDTMIVTDATHPETFSETVHMHEAETSDNVTSVSDEEIASALLSGQVERKLAGRISDKEIAAKGLMIFLDAADYHDKCQIFLSLRQYLNDTMLNNIAVTLDLVLDDGSPEQHFDTILNCLQTHEHYECNRLR